jgi:hypothetical protein
MTSSPGRTTARMTVMMACVAPAVMVISLLAGRSGGRTALATLAAMASRSGGTPVIGGYWFRPLAWRR